jgi:hypothetical protein
MLHKKAVLDIHTYAVWEELHRRHCLIGPMPLMFNTQTMHFKSKTHNSIAMFLQKTLQTWRDSNPGLLSLRPTPPGQLRSHSYFWRTPEKKDIFRVNLNCCPSKFVFSINWLGNIKYLLYIFVFIIYLLFIIYICIYGTYLCIFILRWTSEIYLESKYLRRM